MLSCMKKVLNWSYKIKIDFFKIDKKLPKIGVVGAIWLLDSFAHHTLVFLGIGSYEELEDFLHLILEFFQSYIIQNKFLYWILNQYVDAVQTACDAQRGPIFNDFFGEGVLDVFAIGLQNHFVVNNIYRRWF